MEVIIVTLPLGHSGPVASLFAATL